MPINIRLKFWFFEHYWWLLSLAIAIAVTALAMLKEPLPTIATVVGAILSVAYFLQKQKLEELKLFREIFKECNERYDRMNEDLVRIAAIETLSFNAGDRGRIVDYLNLCGEEYLYFKRGYIEPSVWQAWHAGMKTVISAPCIAHVWQEEKNTGSYYDLPL